MGLSSDLRHLPEVPSWCLYDSHIDQPSEGSWPSRAVYGVQLCQDGLRDSPTALLPLRGTASLSAPDDPDCMPFHGHFLHPDCTGNHRRKSFSSLIPNRNLWLRVTIVACYREQIHKGVYPRAWC